MTKLAHSAPASGTGTVTIAAPVTNTNRTITMPDAAGNVVLDSAAQTLTNKSFQSAPAVLTPQSMVRLNTANGYGSTNTAIRRFTNVVTNQGGDISYADSATLGASFTINTAGVYAIHYNDQFSAASFLGISLNSSQLTTSILTITVADIVCVGSTSGADLPYLVSATLFLPAGSVVRAHTALAGTGARPNNCQFTIARVA